MFYKLASHFFLRGWDRLPNGVVDTRNGRTAFVDAEMMSVLKLCTGRIDFELPLISDGQRKLAAGLAEFGTVVPCEKPDPIEPEQEYKLYPNRFVSQAHWSITGRCNYKCRHCFMSAPDAKLGELPHKAIMGLIDELAGCGVFCVTLTGGEPLVRADFWEIVDALRERHIHIDAVYTNGGLVSAKLLEGFRDRGLTLEFNMSFDGTEGWHDWLRGVPDATERIDRAFRLCRDYGFSTAAEMCLHEGNKHTLRDSVNYLASVGCREVKVNPVSDEGAWHEGGYGRSIEPEELYKLYLDYIPQYYADGKPMGVMLGGFFYDSPRSSKYLIPMIKSGCRDMDKVAVCGHARNVMYISPEGRALPCTSLSGSEIQQQFPLILEKGLDYCLTDSLYMKLIESPVSAVLKHNERCTDCEYAVNCRGGCRASALESSPEDLFGIDEAACLLFRGGYVEKIMAAVTAADPGAVCRSKLGV